MRNAVIVDAVRSPMAKGKAGGGLSTLHPTDLLAHTLRNLLERTKIAPSTVDDVIGGCVTQAGEQAWNLTRTAVLGAGFPESVPATTVDRQCGSSQQAAHFAAQGVMSGAYDIAIACGVESMSRQPMGSSLQEGKSPFGDELNRRYPEGLVNQGISAELIAAKWGISRGDCDEFAASSHERAAAAQASGRFDTEIVPIRVASQEGTQLASKDETIRPGTTAENLASLKPAFYDKKQTERFPEIDWVITPGNSSQLTDGASAVLIMGEDTAHELGLSPRARFHSFAVAAEDPLYMLTAIIPATKQILARSGFTIDDIDLFEVNEAFAPVVLAWQAETGASLDRTNVEGGAIALGHPLGCTGARLMTTLLNSLEARDHQLGLQVMCEGGGMANATIIERL